MIEANIFLTNIALAMAISIFGVLIISWGIGKMNEIIDGSKYSYIILKWWFTAKKEWTKQDEKKFISIRDMEAIQRMQKLVNTLCSVAVKKMPYKEITHPFFVWHKNLFMRATGNNIVRVVDGKTGIIPEDEIVDSVIISEKFDEVVASANFARLIKENIKSLGIDFEFPEK